MEPFINGDNKKAHGGTVRNVPVHGSLFQSQKRVLDMFWAVADLFGPLRGP